MTRTEAVAALVDTICDDTQDAAELATALTVSAEPMGYPLENQTEALATIGHWVEIAGDLRRNAKAGEKLKWQLIEGLLERASHSLDKGIIGTMSLNKSTMFGGAGRP